MCPSRRFSNARKYSSIHCKNTAARNSAPCFCLDLIHCRLDLPEAVMQMRVLRSITIIIVEPICCRQQRRKHDSGTPGAGGLVPCGLRRESRAELPEAGLAAGVRLSAKRMWKATHAASVLHQQQLATLPCLSCQMPSFHGGWRFRYHGNTTKVGLLLHIAHPRCLRIFAALSPALPRLSLGLPHIARGPFLSQHDLDKKPSNMKKGRHRAA